MDNFKVAYGSTVRRIWRYWIGKKFYSLKCQARKSTLTPKIDVDADWGGSTLNHKSTTGFVIMMAGEAVSWCSRKQETVALCNRGEVY